MDGKKLLWGDYGYPESCQGRGRNSIERGIHRSLAGMDQWFRKILMGVLEECRSQGLAKSLNAEDEAHPIIAMVEGLDFYSYFYRDPDAIRSIGKAFKEMIWAPRGFISMKPVR